MILSLKSLYIIYHLFFMYMPTLHDIHIGVCSCDNMDYRQCWNQVTKLQSIEVATERDSTLSCNFPLVTHPNIDHWHWRNCLTSLISDHCLHRNKASVLFYCYHIYNRKINEKINMNVDLWQFSLYNNYVKKCSYVVCHIIY